MKSIYLLKNKIDLLSEKGKSHKYLETEIVDKDALNAENIDINNEHNEVIQSINKTNIDDLEAIYFFDRVNMRSKSAPYVPKLNLKFANNTNNTQTKQKIEENKKQIKNNTLENVKPSINSTIGLNKKTNNQTTSNLNPLQIDEIYLDNKDMKNNKFSGYSTKASSTSVKNDLKKLSIK